MRKLTCLIFISFINMSLACSEKILELKKGQKYYFANYNVLSAIKVLPINTLPELKKIKNEPFSAEVIIEEKCSSDCPIRFLKFIDIKIEGTPVVGLENAPSKIVKESKCNFK